MRANLEATQGLLFADAAAARLSARIGREEAHHLVEKAAEQVRETGTDLRSVLGQLTDQPLDEAFDLGPAVAAAGSWVDRALAEARRVCGTLS
jgi:3-carboxy-cis,cis-muconate cycloisomerase